jgi:hypothetical protein
VLRRRVTCGYCVRIINYGDPCTMMKRGEFGGTSLHPSCARLWYLDHLSVGAGPPQLVFDAPPALLRDYLQAFIRLDFQRGHIDNTAGGGKSNSIVYAVSLIRAMDESVLVCMLGKEAKQEMLRRGLMAFEVNNYHSITDRAYKVSTISIAEANAYNAPQRARSCSRRRCL